MKKWIFRTLSRFNKTVLPSYTKQGLDMAKASKFQMLLLGWKLWVTKNAVNQ